MQGVGISDISTAIDIGTNTSAPLLFEETKLSVEWLNY